MQLLKALVVVGAAGLASCGETPSTAGGPGSAPPKIELPAPQYSHDGGRVRYVRQGIHWYKWYLNGSAAKWERVPDALVPRSVLEAHAQRAGIPVEPSATEDEITLLPTVPEPPIPGEAGEILDRLRSLDSESFQILTEAAAAGDLSDDAFKRLREIDEEMGKYGCQPRKQFPTPAELQPEDWFSPHWLGRLHKHLLREMRLRDPATLDDDERRGSTWPDLEMRIFFVLDRQAAIESIRRAEHEGTINPFDDPAVPHLWWQCRTLFDTYARTRSGSAYRDFKMKVKELAPRVGLTEVDVDRRVRAAWLERR